MTSKALTLPKPQGASNVLIGWICPGDVSNRFAASLADTLICDPERRITGKICLQSSPRIVESRTMIVRNFLRETSTEWLLTVDADMAWSYEDFDLLCRSADADRRPIIGGLCFAGGRAAGPLNIFPTLYDIKKDENGELTSEYITDYPRNRIVEVSGTGAAFMLVHRRVLLDMEEKLGLDGRNPYPWYAETFIADRPIGEDLTFCIRATSLGYKIHVHTGVKIGHEKRYLLTEELFDDNNRQSDQ